MLTTTQINRLAQSLTDTKLGRAATPEKAARRFTKLLAERIGEDAAALEVPAILGAGGFEISEGRLAAALDEAETEAVCGCCGSPRECLDEDRWCPDCRAGTVDTDADTTAGDTPEPTGAKAGAARKVAEPKAPAEMDPKALRDAIAAGSARQSEARLRQIAEAGLLPPAPDFSTIGAYKPYRRKLAEVVDAAQRGDVEAMFAVEVNPSCTAPKKIIAYRDAAKIAIERGAAMEAAL